jgi:hypothetical protein
MVSPDGIKSNSKTTPLVTVPAARALSSGSVPTLDVAGALLVKLVELFGPCAPTPLPVVNNIPAAKGKAGLALVKEVTLLTGVLAFNGLPLIVMLNAVTPNPSNTLFTNCVGVCPVLTAMLWEFKNWIEQKRRRNGR